MIHYTCDRCKRLIDPIEHTRHIVQIDIQSSSDEPDSGVDDEIDHLAVLHHALEGDDVPLHDTSIVGTECDGRSHHGRYDLCHECYAQLLRNPLGRDAVLALGFSNN